MGVKPNKMKVLVLSTFGTTRETIYSQYYRYVYEFKFEKPTPRGLRHSRNSGANLRSQNDSKLSLGLKAELESVSAGDELDFEIENVKP